MLISSWKVVSKEFKERSLLMSIWKVVSTEFKEMSLLISFWNVVSKGLVGFLNDWAR